MHILLSDTTVLLTTTLWDLMQNGEVLVYRVINDWNGI